jgi:hypothetical protein
MFRPVSGSSFVYNAPHLLREAFMKDSSETHALEIKLLSNETIHWYGKPNPWVIFGPADRFLIPFSLLCGVFAFYWEYTTFNLESQILNGGPFTYLYPITGIPVILVALYLIIGRFFYKFWLKTKTIYAVSNKRLIVITQGKSRKERFQFLNHIKMIEKSVDKNGAGSLTFGDLGRGGLFTNAGIFLIDKDFQGVLSFFDLPDAEEVYQLVDQLRPKK